MASLEPDVGSSDPWYPMRSRYERTSQSSVIAVVSVRAEGGRLESEVFARDVEVAYAAGEAIAPGAEELGGG